MTRRETWDAIEKTSASCARLIDALRVAQAPPEVLAAVRAHLDAAAAMLEPHATPGPHAQSAPDLEPEDFFGTRVLEPHEVMPYSPIIGPLNPVSPRLAFHVDGERVRGSGRFPVRFVGAPQTAHGGLVAAALDEIMGLVNFLNGAGAFTGTLTVRYHRPTPIERDLELLGETVEVDGRKIRSRAEIRCDGEITASAEGLFIRPR